MQELTGEAIALRQGRATNAMLVFAKGTDHDERAKKLMKIKAKLEVRPDHFQMGWQRISSAPFDRDLELAVIDAQGLDTLVFPCRRVLHGWTKAGTNEPVNVYPTHWREWDDSVSSLFCRPAS